MGGDACNSGQRALNRLLAAGGTAGDNRHRRLRRQAVANQRRGHLSNAVRAQHEDLGPRSLRHLRPISVGGRL